MARFRSPEISSVRVEDRYLASRISSNRSSTIPAALARCRETGRIDAFKLDWKPGMANEPHVYWDSDLAKVLEGMADELLLAPDETLRKELDEIVDLVVSAQQPDGYLNTHFTVVEPENRFKKLHSDHELYCAGHLIEAAVSHFQATGKRNFLDCVCRYADYIASVFGRGEGQKRGYPGHEEIELALCKLAKATGEKRYLDLAKYFIDERGQEPNYLLAEGEFAVTVANVQAKVPVRELTEAVGHAVRMVYLLCGMADVADATADKGLLEVCERLADDILERKCFVTGGIGQTLIGEAFAKSYDLWNHAAYTESCAAIGLVLFLRRMHEITGDVRYLDGLERTLYNGALSGISLSGDRFFYPNPLLVNERSPFARERQPWFGCSCCPTNYCRFLPQIGTFLWSENDDEVRLDIPAASEFKAGRRHLRVSGGYPYDGQVAVELLADGAFALTLRVPAWASSVSFKRNGKAVDVAVRDGFATFAGPWRAGDVVEMELPMEVRVLRAHEQVDADAGQIALARGPVVYALESVDNEGPLTSYVVDPSKGFTLDSVEGLPAGTVAIRGSALRVVRPGEALYSTEPLKAAPVSFVAIPSALWQNRGPADMQVWMREKLPF